MKHIQALAIALIVALAVPPVLHVATQLVLEPEPPFQVIIGDDGSVTGYKNYNPPKLPQPPVNAPGVYYPQA